MKRTLDLARKLALHAMVLLAVVIIPVFVFDTLSRSDMEALRSWSFVGALTYPAYLGYWLLQLRSERAKLVLFHLLIVVTASLAVLTAVSTASALVICFPLLLCVLPLPLSLGLRLCGKTGVAKSLFLSVLVSLPAGAALTGFAFLGAARSAMSGMRW